MYVTSIITPTNDRVITTTQDRVDALFNGEPLPEVSPFILDSRPIRTRTKSRAPFAHSRISRETIASFTNRAHILRGVMNYMNPNENYYSFSIPKRSGGFRSIDAPETVLKEFMYEELKFLKKQNIWAHDAAWAYVERRDVVGAMKEHTNNHSRWYLKLDLKNFFGSCTEEFIIAQLLKLYPFAMIPTAREYLVQLARLACKDGVLPQGTPLSPYLTNLIMVEFDYKLAQLINNFQTQQELPRVIYTRYADDILISCKDGFPWDTLVTSIKEMFEPTPLRINDDKTRYASNAGRNWNLGIMCNKDNQLTIGHRRKKQIKNAIHNFMSTPATWELQELQELLGQLAWFAKVEPVTFKAMCEYWHNKYEAHPKELLILMIKRLLNN